MHRRHLVSGGAAAFLVGILGRSIRATAQESTPSSDTRDITDARGTVVSVPVNPERIVALGEEFLLADLLELGVKPAASSANYLTEYVGIDPALTEGLTPFSLWDADLEMLVELNADLVLVPQIYWDVNPEMFETISMMATTVVLPSTDSWPNDFRFLASIFGEEALAETLISDLEAETAATKEALAIEGETVSYVTVYPGGTDLTLWTLPAVETVEIGVALGVTVLPDPADLEPDRIGRVYVSLERANLLTGDTLIMLQTRAGMSEEEDDSLEAVLGSELFQSIPAVQNDRVFTLERVGFPGEISGRRKLLAAYSEIFGGASATPTAG